MACKLLIIGACIFFNTRDQNKSFLSLRSAESNRTRVWFSVQVWYLGKAIAYREGRERWFENWKYRIVIFYFLIQIPPQPPPLEICVPRSLTGWKTSTNWFPALTSQCLRLFLLEQEKKKKCMGCLAPESSFPFHSPLLLTVRILLVPGLGGNGCGLHCESKAASRCLNQRAFPGDEEGPQPPHYVPWNQVRKCGLTGLHGLSIFLAKWQWHFRARKSILLTVYKKPPGSRLFSVSEKIT